MVARDSFKLSVQTFPRYCQFASKIVYLRLKRLRLTGIFASHPSSTLFRAHVMARALSGFQQEKKAQLFCIVVFNYYAPQRTMPPKAFELCKNRMTKDSTAPTPRILKRLGPIMNDAIGGLVAGVSSNMYTRATSEVSGQCKSHQI